MHISYMVCVCFVWRFVCFARVRSILYAIGWTSTWCCAGRLAKPVQSAGPLAGHERAESHSRSILSNSRASASAAGPATSGFFFACLASFCRSFSNQNFHPNFHPILMRFCLQLGLQNPPKIHPKSISRVSLKFDAILVRFFPIFL